MALFKYFSRDASSPKESSFLTEKEKDIVSELVANAEKEAQRSVRYEYTAEERAAIGKYTAENGPAKACRQFSKTLGKKIPESIARRLRNEYLAKVKEEICDGSSPGDSIRFTNKEARKAFTSWSRAGPSGPRSHQRHTQSWWCDQYYNCCSYHQRSYISKESYTPS